ncbi:glycosyl transferase family 2 [Tannerella sp. oral taxon 808]|nr:glycosyl transferase family 2 [Tannerella sp. oral taxon 808]
MKISIVIPVYNSAHTIGRVVGELIEALKPPRYEPEIILVNDDSPDDSEAACIDLHRRYPGIVRFYSLAKNVGEHNAVMAGLNQVTGAYTVIVDDDFQNPTAEVVRLFDYIATHDVDVVYTYYAHKQHSAMRNLGSRFNDRVANIMLRKPHDLYLSSFKALNLFIVREIIRYDLPFPYIDGLILRTTSKIGRLQVEHCPRREGKSGYTLRKLVTLWMNMFINFSILPLRAVVVLGFVFALFGFGLGIYAVVDKLMHPGLPMGYTTMAVMIALFAGIQLIAIGMVGEYLGRVFLSQNKRPQYCIRKRFE